ncbi:hypothetical protein [Ruegeria faecimaris]|uniref:hypothetical protein n=1 Tax=Ruegeria faecimaris TaxID=686389 RepID=UPI00232D24CB|nr:hypothetical protein [Ruegeria faecimaris]
MQLKERIKQRLDDQKTKLLSSERSCRLRQQPTGQETPQIHPGIPPTSRENCTMVKTVTLDADPRLDSTAPESMGATLNNVYALAAAQH